MSFLNELKLSLESQSESLKENEYSNLSMETLCNDIRYLAYSDPNIEYFGISTEGVKEFAEKTTNIISTIFKWIKEKMTKFIKVVIGFINSKERKKKQEEILEAVNNNIEEVENSHEQVVDGLSENNIEDNKIIINKKEKEKGIDKKRISLYLSELKIIEKHHSDKLKLPLEVYNNFLTVSNSIFDFYNKYIDTVKSKILPNIKNITEESIRKLYKDISSTTSLIDEDGDKINLSDTDLINNVVKSAVSQAFGNSRLKNDYIRSKYVTDLIAVNFKIGSSTRLLDKSLVINIDKRDEAVNSKTTKRLKEIFNNKEWIRNIATSINKDSTSTILDVLNGFVKTIENNKSIFTNAINQLNTNNSKLIKYGDKLITKLSEVCTTIMDILLKLISELMRYDKAIYTYIEKLL